MKKFFLICLLTILSLPSYPEAIRLKDGKAIEAKVIEETDNYIKVDFYGATLTYYLEDIESIDGVTPGFSDVAGQDIPASPEDKAVQKKTPVSVKFVKINKSLLSQVFKVIKSDKGYDASTYFGAGMLCLGLASYQWALDSAGQGQAAFLYPDADTELLDEFRRDIIDNAQKAVRKSISSGLKEYRFILGLVLVNLIKLDNFNFRETIQAVEKLRSLDTNNSLPYYLGARLDLGMYREKEAWESIKKVQDKTIVADEYSMYTAILDFLRALGYDEASSVILSAVMVKSIHAHILSNIMQPVAYLSEEEFKSKSLFGQRSPDVLEYAQVEIKVGRRLASMKPQSFLSEAFGYMLENSGYEKLKTLYQEQKDTSRLTRTEQVMKTLENTMQARQFLFRRIVAASKDIPNQAAQRRFFVDSFKVGEEEAAQKHLGVE